jgi:glycosyltransferase involved in cell wall biosynthesis
MFQKAGSTERCTFHQKRISVALVIESLEAGGAQRQLVELARNLDPDRYRVRVLTYRPHDFFEAELKQSGIPVTVVRRNRKLDPVVLTTLVRWFRRREVDLVHAYLESPNLYAVAARRIAGQGRAIASERCDWRQLKGYVRAHVSWSYRHADLVIANSVKAHSDIQTDLSLGHERVRYVPNCVDMSRFSPPDAGNGQDTEGEPGSAFRRVLTVSSYKPEKNHGGILEAVRNSPALRARVKLVWVGPPQPEEEYRRLCSFVQQKGLGDCVEIRGPSAHVEEIYRECDVFLLNSTYEGTPNVILEAMACGKPVVATRISDMERYVVHGVTGWLVPKCDPRALEGRLEEIVHMDTRALQAMGRSGREHVAAMGLDPRSIAEQHEALYESVLASGRS